MERLCDRGAVAAGLDVLHTDATCIVRVDFLPMLKSVPDVDILAQRDSWPSDPIRKIGTAANAGFNYLRASRVAPRSPSSWSMSSSAASLSSTCVGTTS